MSDLAGTIVLERGVPRVRSGRLATYPWAGMAVGDSFRVEGGAERQRSLYSAAANWSRRNRPGARWETRTVIEQGVTYVRIWRTA